MLSHPHYFRQESGKATSHLSRIHRQSALQGGAKAQGYALCFPPEAHRAKKEHLDNASPTSRDCRGKAAATAPNVSMEVNADGTQPPFRCTQVHKKPPHARQRKPMRKAAK